MARVFTTLSFLLSCLMIAILIVVGGMSYIQLKQFNPLLSQYLSTLTHQPIIIEGHMTPRLLPTMGLHLPQITIGQPKTAYTAVLTHVTLHPSVKALFHGKLVFNKIKIKHLQLDLNPSLLTQLPTLPTSTPSTLFRLHRLVIQSGDILLHTPHHLFAFTQVNFDGQPFNIGKTPIAITLATALQIDPNDPLQATTSNCAFTGNLSLADNLLQPHQPLLQSIGLDGTLTASDLKHGPLTLPAVNTTLTTKDSTILFNPLKIQFEAGTAMGDASFDTKTGLLLLNGTGSQLQAASLLKLLSPSTPLTGTLNFNIHHQLQLFQANYFNTLSGNGSVQITHGSINRFNLNYLIDYAIKTFHVVMQGVTNPLPSTPPPAISKPQLSTGNTTFDNMTLHYHQANNTQITGTYLFQNPQLELHANGIYRVATTALQASLMAHLNTQDPATNQLQTLLGGQVPLLLAGPIQHLDVTPNLAKISPYFNQMVAQHLINVPTHQLQKQLRFLFQLPQPLMQ